MHDVVAVLRPQSLDLDDALGHQMIPTSLNTIANTASTIMTTVIEVTTELVVPMPRLSVLGSMRNPKWQATSAISRPNTMPLPSPSHRLAIGTASGRLDRK